MIKIKVDHVGLVVKDMKAALKFYEEMFGFKLPKTGPYSAVIPETMEKMGHDQKYALIRAPNDDFYIELTEPKTGNYVKRLEKSGEGSMHELCVEIDTLKEFKEFRRRVEKMGMTVLDENDRPLAKGEYQVAPTGSMVFYLPRDMALGTWIEILYRPWKHKSRRLNKK